MTELDIWAIKERIVAILKNNTSLYTTTAEADKLKQISSGFTQGKTGKEGDPPHAFVTNARNLETISPVSVISNAWKSLNHILNFEIHIVVNGKDSKDTENKLDDFRKLVLDTLEANNQLKDPTAGNDPKVSTSWCDRISYEGNGDPLQKIIINLHCRATT